MRDPLPDNGYQISDAELRRQWRALRYDDNGMYVRPIIQLHPQLYDTCKPDAQGYCDCPVIWPGILRRRWDYTPAELVVTGPPLPWLEGL